MAYSNNPNLPRARAIALKLLIEQSLSVQVVANKCGIHRSTLYRWWLKWKAINKNVQLENFNRPTRKLGSQFRFAALRWPIPTLSSRPKHSPNAVPEGIVTLVIKLRQLLNRCAEVVWHHITTIDRIDVSLSSVRRILRRHHCFDGARKKRVRPDNPRRPHVTRPGELVETDTIHYMCPYTKRRRYVYTVIDLYSRMAHAEIHSHIRPSIAANTIAHASNLFGFTFHMVQADNGPEFSHYFEQKLAKRGTTIRHSRLGRPNDNAHIERFNRTIQEECLGSKLTYRTTNIQIQAKIEAYLVHYNTKRVHLGIQLRTPAQMLQRS